MAPIVLRLGMHGRVTVNFASGCLENTAFQPLGETQHINGAVYGGLRCLNRIVLILNRRRWAREIVYFIHLHKKRKCHVVANELKTRMRVEMFYVPFGAGEEVVSA